MVGRRRVTPREYAKQLAAVDLDRVAQALLAVVEKATSARWDAAVARAAALPGDVRPEKMRALSDSFARELAGVGAAAGMAAAAPAVGTTVSVMAATAELGWFTARAGDLILTIAALHGRPTPTVEERRAWVLAVLIFGSTARQGFASAANQLGANLDDSKKSAISLTTLRAVNGALSRQLLRHYGARRGAIALGTALPLGVGALVGGSANFVAVRKLVRQADGFFAHLPYSSIDVHSIEVAGDL